MKIFLLLLQTFLLLYGGQQEDTQLKKMIGKMLIVGFDEETIFYNSQVIKEIQTYNLGGVILFDRFYNDKKRVKNILNPYQLKNLTSEIQKYTKNPLFIGVDQEGGKVARLKAKYGFLKIPSALNISHMKDNEAKTIYESQADMLSTAGINLNFAPVVDLSLNPKNSVIVGLERSYGTNAQNVVSYASILIKAQKKKHILSVLKHFPGHGSSMGDSHEGFVDITDTWSSKELQPYKLLIQKGLVDAIMTAHVFNAKLDAKYPATLSYKINTKLLREKLQFKGLIISDDMQMKAISQHYTLKESTTLAINSGVDILLFANQLASNSVQEIVETIYEQVKQGKISIQRIKEANRCIQNMQTKYSIIQKPIIFTDKRTALTKEYIKNHYGFDVKDITILPKTVVVHWTAMMDFNKSFARLNPELLFSDRVDIQKASKLNVSAHYLINRKGVIYQLMPDNIMARHVIGLNYSSIGIENVGGKENKHEDLTPAQLRANIALINYLKSKYPTIENIIGHYEYRNFEKTKLWLEKDKSYRTQKSDPGKEFMHKLRVLLDK